MCDRLESVNAACAITALAFLGSGCVMAGSGPYVHIYRLYHKSRCAEATGDSNDRDYVHRERVFHSETIHKIVVQRVESPSSASPAFEMIVVGKSLVNMYAVSICPSTSEVTFCLMHRLREREGAGLVLDAVFLSDGKHVVLGLGANEAVVYRRDSGELVLRCQSAVRSGLFSMAIHPPIASADNTSGHKVTIASGTAFGPIYIWDADVASLSSTADKQNTSGVAPSQKLSGHEGFVFKLRWSPCGRRLASGSDDRSVRVWGTKSGGDIIHREEKAEGEEGVAEGMEQLFVGWGHTCRVWDVLFLRGSLLASSSEDLTVMIWDYDQNACMSTIFAHVGRHVWCISYDIYTDCICSGGNDSSVKVWNVELSMYLSRDEKAPSSTRRSEFAISPPRDGAISTTYSTKGTNIDVIIAVKVSPSSEEVVLVYASGQIATCSLVHGDEVGHIRYLTDVIWSPIVHNMNCNSTANAAAIYFVEDKSPTMYYTALGLYDGSAVVAFISSNEVKWCYAWKAHAYKLSGVWVSQSDGTFIDVITASVGGEVKVWKLTIDNIGESSSVRAEMVVCVTNAKKQMASACLLMQSGSLVIGGCKGSLAYFDIRAIHANKEMHQSIEDLSVLPALEPTFARVHSMGTSPIADIVECDGGFLVSGHDGNVNVYVITPSNEFRINQTLSTSNVSISDSFYLPSQYKPKPEGYDSVERNDSVSKLQPVYIGGFQSNMFEVWDISTKYCVMRTNGGGWRRLHSCSVRPPNSIISMNSNSGVNYALPDATFVSIDSTGKVPVLNACSYRMASDDSIDKGTLMRTFGKASNGRVMYAGTCISIAVDASTSSSTSTSTDTETLFVGAGEEGVLKVFRIPSLDVVQEVLFPASSLVRSLSTATLPDGTGVLIAAGGRLAHAVWSFRAVATAGDYSIAPLEGSFGAVNPLGAVLHCEYSNDPGAEHRGLCCASWCDTETISTDLHCEYVIGDSRGVVRHFRFVKSHYSPVLIQEFVVSECPVLCCKVFALPCSTQVVTQNKRQVVIGVFGDTAGYVYVYELNSELKSSRLLRRCKVQMMGTDALEVALLRDTIHNTTYHSSSSSNTNSISSSDGDTNTTRVFELAVLSGGDDQSVGVALMNVCVSSESVKSDIVAAVRVDGVCGSAVHALSILRTNASRTFVDIACASLDQRLYFWQCDLYKIAELYKIEHHIIGDDDSNSNPIDESECLIIAASCNVSSPASPLVWRSGDVLHTPDVGAMGIITTSNSSSTSSSSKESNKVEKEAEDESYCVVVGEGIQVFRFNLAETI